jgi:large subunit ribosomal protein L24
MLRFKKDDIVMVTCGKDKGKIGKILNVTTKKTCRKVIIEGLNYNKKHIKSNPNKGIAGGIINKESPIDYSNISHIDKSTNKKSRVGFSFFIEEGKKKRVLKENKDIIIDV